jgi:hypothetical protein
MEYGLQGVVHTVEWTCRITRWGTEDNDFVATSGKTVLQSIDPNVEHFVQFHDLNEEMVLEWVRAEMLEKWGETEKDIVSAWEKSRWAKDFRNHDGLPWDGGVLRSTEEEEEPSWVKAAIEVTKFEPLEMVEEDSEGAKENVTKSEKNPYVNEEGRTGITFGTNVDKEEE